MAHLLHLQVLLVHSYHTQTSVLHVPYTKNALADVCSWALYLTDTDVLSFFDYTFPMQPSWQMYHLRPNLASWLTSAMLQQTHPLASPPPAPSKLEVCGAIYVSSVWDSTSMPSSPALMIPSLYSNSMPTATALETFLPANMQRTLAWGNKPFALLVRCSSAWGPMIPT